MGDWDHRFFGWNDSGESALNFVWHQDNIYVMDNHLAAAWCWSQAISNESAYSFLHVDQHYDLQDGRLDEWAKGIETELSSMTIYQYASLEDPTSEWPLFRWGNYIRLFARLCPNVIAESYLATHKVGTLNDATRVAIGLRREIPEEDLLDVLPEVLRGSGLPWIFNVDLDYFAHASGSQAVRFMSDDFIRQFFQILVSHLQATSVLTVAFSPECCGGWEQAEELWQIADSVLQTGFRLPPKRGHLTSRSS